MSTLTDRDFKHHQVERAGPVKRTQFLPDRRNVLLVTGGHPFAHEPFFKVFDSNPEINWSHVDHPAAQLMFSARAARHFDCFVLYDMPGIEFRPGEAPIYHAPPRAVKEGLKALGNSGVGFVVLHHAAAGWPIWPEWREFVGAQFLYSPRKSFGKAMPDSGYLLEVAHRVSPIIEHPVTKGIKPFSLTDELYLWPGPTQTVTPILASDFEFVYGNFYSAARALEGQLFSRQDWTHPPGSNIVGWVKTYRRSPVVYLQFGDGPSAYVNENYRRLLANAINFVSQGVHGVPPQA